MATPDLLPGNLFRLYRSAGGGPETFTFVCIATSRTLTQTAEFEDATVPDCTTPTSIPARKSIKRSTAWNLRFAGVMDAGKWANMRTDFDATSPQRYQIMVDKASASGGGTYTGAIWLETVEQGTENNGLVRFTIQARGDDTLTWAAAA